MEYLLTLKQVEDEQQSMNDILSYNFKQKYYLNNVYMIFGEICYINNDDDDNNQMIDECCKYFKNICVHLTENELICLSDILCYKLIKENGERNNKLYFEMLSILSAIGIKHSSKSSLILNIKKSLNINKLVREKYHINVIEDLLYFVDDNIILNDINENIINKKKKKLNIFVKHICKNKLLNNNKRFMDQCINYLKSVSKEIVFKYLNDSFWSLCVKTSKNCQELLIKIDISKIINDNDNLLNF